MLLVVVILLGVALVLFSASEDQQNGAVSRSIEGGNNIVFNPANYQQGFSTTLLN